MRALIWLVVHTHGEITGVARVKAHSAQEANATLTEHYRLAYTDTQWADDWRTMRFHSTRPAHTVLSLEAEGVK